MLKQRRYLEKLFAHVETWRPYTVIWSGLVSLAGACIARGDFPPFEISVLSFVIPVLGWIAGLYASDYIDRELDAVEKPHRPIPSGRLKPSEVVLSAFIFAGIGLISSIILGWVHILLVFIVATLVLAYSKISKARGVLGNINRGTLIMLTFLFGVFTYSEVVFSATLFSICILFFLHDVNSNLIGAARDVYGDREMGYETFPVTYGVRKTILLSMILTVTWIIIGLTIIYSKSTLRFPWITLSLFSSGILVLVTGYIYLLRSRLRRMDLLRMHSLFIFERVILASSFILGVVSNTLTGFMILSVSLLVTFLSEQSLRKRYEFAM